MSARLTAMELTGMAQSMARQIGNGWCVAFSVNSSGQPCSQVYKGHRHEVFWASTWEDAITQAQAFIDTQIEPKHAFAIFGMDAAGAALSPEGWQCL